MRKYLPFVLALIMMAIVLKSNASFQTRLNAKDMTLCDPQGRCVTSNQIIDHISE